MPFKIATWNINSVRLRSGLVEQFIKTHQPDILCLQEIKCQNDQFPSKPFEKLGYEHIVVHGQKAYHGVATLSRHPIETNWTQNFCEMGDARHIATTHQVGSAKFCLHNYYVPAGGDVPDPSINPKFDHKLRFVNEMFSFPSSYQDMENIMVGDLNIAPHENDVWSHKQLLKVVSHTPVETELLSRLLDQGSWVDLVRRHIPEEEKLYSWWSYRAKDWNAADKGRRLDHIWSSAGPADRLSGVEVLREARGWEKPSDHAPVIATFDF